MLRTIAGPVIIFMSQLAFATDDCEFYTKQQWGPFYINYDLDCKTGATDLIDLSICLIQRNTLNVVMGCADLNPNRVLLWDVEAESPIDRMDLIPPDTFRKSTVKHVSDYDNDYDGKLQITPRGVLWAASVLPQCDECDMTAAIKACPHADFQEFLTCLCCECVTVEDLACFQKCIFYEDDSLNYADRKDYYPLKDVCDTGPHYCDKESYEDQTCKLPEVTKSHFQENRMAAYIDSSSTIYPSPSCTSSVYVVQNGYRTLQCADSSYGYINTRISSTTTWTKAAAVSASSTSGVTASAFGARNDATNAVSESGVAAQTVDLGTPQTTTSTNVARSIGKNILPVWNFVAFLVASEIVLFVV